MGSVGRAHGIKGEVGVIWHGASPPRIGSVIYLGDEADPRAYRVLSATSHKGRQILALEGINDRTAAEKLTGMPVYLSRASLPSAGEDEAYLCDLEGMEIYLPDGAKVGRLDHVEFPAGQEIWSISGVNGQEVLFPAQPEFIVSFDLTGGKIVIDPPPGLLEIYNA